MTVLTMSAAEVSRYDTLIRVERGELRVHAATPHHRKRNNSEPARSSQSVGIFAPAKPVSAKVDGRRSCAPKLKRGPWLSNEELIARGLGEYARQECVGSLRLIADKYGGQ